MNEHIYTVTEFAKLIKSTRMTVLRMIKAKKILAFRLSNAPRSAYRIKGKEVERLILDQNHKNILKEMKEEKI